MFGLSLPFSPFPNKQAKAYQQEVEHAQGYGATRAGSGVMEDVTLPYYKQSGSQVPPTFGGLKRGLSVCTWGFYTHRLTHMLHACPAYQGDKQQAAHV